MYVNMHKGNFLFTTKYRIYWDCCILITTPEQFKNPISSKIATYYFLLTSPKFVALTQFGLTGNTTNFKEFQIELKKIKHVIFISGL